MKKRTLALTLLASLALTLLTACASDASSDTGTAADTTAAETTSAEAVTEPAYILPDEDYDGYNFRIIARIPYDSAWIMAAYNEIDVDTENGETLNDAIFTRNRLTEEQLNITIEHVTGGVSNFSVGKPALTAILAGDDVFDAMYVNGSDMPMLLGSEGALIALNDIDTLELDKEWWDQNSVRDLCVMGKNWCASGDMSLMTMGAVVALMYNKGIVEDIGYDQPYEAVTAGTWTFDKLQEMSMAASRDLDGNGKFDENDAFGYAAYGGVLQTALSESGCPMTENDSDGVPHLTLNSERTVSVIDDWLKLIHDEKSFYASNYTGKVKDVPFDLMSPMFINGRILFYRQQLLGALNLRDMDTDYGIIPPPKYDEAQERYYDCVQYYWSSFVMVPATQPDTDRLGNILNVFGYYSREHIRPAFFDTTLNVKVARDEHTLEMLDIIIDSRIYEPAMIFKWGSMPSLIDAMENTGTNNFASVWAANEAKIQAAVDETIDMMTK